LGARAAAATVVAGGLAAGSYGVASAAASHDAATPASSQALSSPSSSSKPASGHTSSGGPIGVGRLGLGGDFGPGGNIGQGGTITKLDSTSITVEPLFGGTLTVTTNSSTVYREGDNKVARSALAVGEQIAFLPEGRLTSSSASGSKVVTVVEIVQPHVSGKVVKVDGSELVVSEEDGLNVTVNTSSSTSYGEAGQSASSSAVQVGTVVSVTGTLSPDHEQIDATTIEIVLPSVAGRVTAVSGTTITITSFDGTAETLTTDSSTVFRNSSGKTSIASVAKGDLVEASGAPGTGSSFAASTVYIGPELPSGTGGPRGLGRGGFGGPGFGGQRGFGRTGAGSGQASWSGTGPAFGGDVTSSTTT